MIRFIILFTVIISSAVYGDAKQVSLLTMAVAGKYHRDFFEVYKESDKLFCKTRDMTGFPAKGNPLKGIDWGRLEKDAQTKSSGCGTYLQLSVNKKQFMSCASMPEARKLLEQLTNSCTTHL